MSATAHSLPHPAEPPTVIVLASGRGERFLAAGGGCHKLQASLHGRTVLQRTLDAVQASGLPWYLEDRGWPGMGDSIAAAVRATPQAHGWLILPADLPLVQASTLQLLAHIHPEAAVVVPVVQGQRGHPVRFARTLGPRLAALEGPRGAGSIVADGAVSEVLLDDPGCILDIDTPAELERAQQLWLARSGGREPVGRT